MAVTRWSESDIERIAKSRLAMAQSLLTGGMPAARIMRSTWRLRDAIPASATAAMLKVRQGRPCRRRVTARPSRKALAAL